MAPPVASPCIGVCRLPPGSKTCEGCLRTIAEIGEWSLASDERREQILRDVAARRAAAALAACDDARPNGARLLRGGETD